MSDTDFPNGFVECSECKMRYDSREVYIISHSAPDYEWVGECGHARLKWKNAPIVSALPDREMMTDEEKEIINGN